MMLLTVKELATRLQVKEKTLYAWARQGKIPCVKLNGFLRFDARDIEQWLQKCHVSVGLPCMPAKNRRTGAATSVDHLIESATRAVYTPRGETRPVASPNGREGANGLVKRGKYWCMRFTYHGRQVRRSTGTTDRRLAEAIVGKVRAQIVEGRFFETLEERTRTFDELMERYLTEHAAKKSEPRHYQGYAKSLTDFFGGRTLVEITPKLIADYKALRYAAGLKPASINRELASLKKAFNLAVREWEWCRENPVSKVSMERENNKRDRWLSVEEEARLLQGCAPWLHDLVIFALHTGMRMGEILELTWRGSISADEPSWSFVPKTGNGEPFLSTKPFCRC